MADGYSFLQPGTPLGDYNPTRFIVDSRLARVRTTVYVRVVALGADPGTVNVQPLVSAVDSQGNAFPHGIISNVPYLMLQSGGNAVVVVPAPGDVGIMAVCDRDSSSAKATLASGPPPSGRTFDLSDGVYLGSLLGQTPSQSLLIDASGISIADAFGNTIAMSASGISITSSTPVVINGDVHATGAIIAGFGGVDQVGVQTHEHSANNTPPTPGT